MWFFKTEECLDLGNCTLFLHSRSDRSGNLALHVKKVHHLPGVVADFIAIEEVLKIQTDFLEKYSSRKARIK